eukprot:8895276-Pyramimonas_sp.AAC.1
MPDQTMVSSKELLSVKAETFIELFPPPRISPFLQDRGLKEALSWDIDTGWDFMDPGDRRKALSQIEEVEPWSVALEPPCNAFSQILAIGREHISAEKALEKRLKGLTLLRVAVQVAQMQHQRGRKFFLEHPVGASSWSAKCLRELATSEGMFLVTVDLCRFGLQVSKEGKSKKPTRILTNDEQLFKTLQGHRCECQEPH